ncbi:MAG: DEAD/DEAH box helicase, partial [Phycisphaerae bacterium]
VWKLFVDMSENLHSGLDESLEGSNAWWAGPPKGNGDVLSVIPENQQINIRFATSTPPGENGTFLIYPPRYLEALRSIWSNPDWATRCMEWLEHIREHNHHDAAQMTDPVAFTGRLRKRQKDAFRLAGWDAAYLWGPPGTGKTYTVGAILAQYLIKFPQSRILLLSTTNTAVDQALVAVDKGLEMLGPTNSTAGGLRRKCSRIGSHFIAKHYDGREHLLPVRDERLIQRLMLIESERPDPDKVQAFNNWKLQIEQVRKEIREQAKHALVTARLAAMTTTRAVYSFDDLRSLGFYDLIVFDEASQVGIAHALAIAPLGTHVLFAGDPNQLAPIVQSEHPDAMKWLGDSMFQYMVRSSPSTCQLNEQSRMAESICKIVSNVFYDGQLVVASDCQRNDLWHYERELPSVFPMGRSAVHLELIEQNGQWSQNYHGPIRYHGAEFVCEVVARLVHQGLAEEDIIVLTPFRAQRALLRQKLRHDGFTHVTVSTVHRSQGSERHTVIFDPTDGSSEFLNPRSHQIPSAVLRRRQLDAKRLINVALSRAKARLIVIMSEGDKANPLFAQIANILSPPVLRHPGDGIDVATLVRKPDFPYCAVGLKIRTGDLVGRVTEVIDGGERFLLFDFDLGTQRTIDVKTILRKYGVTITVQPVPPPVEQPRPVQGVVDIGTLVHKPDFPRCALNVEVRNGQLIGPVTHVDNDGAVFQMFDRNTRTTCRIIVSRLREKYADAMD